MLIQKQTIFGDKFGNCYSTCIAALFDLKTEEVPNFCYNENERWFEDANDWVKERGFAIIDIKGVTSFYLLEGTIFLACGDSPRGDFQHCIIIKYIGDNNYKCIMDPHPSNDGIVGVFKTMCLVVKQ